MADGAGERWPRAMKADTAAEYLDVSKTHFLDVIAPGLPFVRWSDRTIRWLRDDLDAWLDQQAGRAAPSRAAAPAGWEAA